MNYNPDVAYTHPGIFHADDVFSTVLLKKIFPCMEVIRTYKVPEDIAADAIVFDMDVPNDPFHGKFDHHNCNFSKRTDGTPYAAFGKLWEEFGWRLCVDEAAFARFEADFVYPVDKQDNGGELSTLSGTIGAMNPNWDEDITPDEAFEYAVDVAEKIFDAELNRCNSTSKAVNLVREAAEKGGQIVELPRFMPWEDVIITEYPEALFVVWYDKSRGLWNVRTVPDAPGSRTGRKLFPQEWCGHPVAELGMTFCHINNFMLACKTREQALNVARIAIEA